MRWDLTVCKIINNNNIITKILIYCKPIETCEITVNMVQCSVQRNLMECIQQDKQVVTCNAIFTVLEHRATNG